jgi:RNA polymerase sigma-70 factor (ECF subfamily)
VLARHGVRERELEDACQEVFLVVHARLAEFEGRSSLRTWLYGIAVRVALNFRRKLGRRQEELEAVPPEGLAEPEQHELTVRRETLTLIERALAELDPDKREVFALYELEGMTMAEVASTLALPENTALYRLYAARDELRARLRQHELRTQPQPAHQARRSLP